MRITGYNPNLEKWCRENLVLDNPEYYKKECMGKWTGNTPKTIALYEKAGDELWLPFGCLLDIWRLYGREVSWDVNISPIRPFFYGSNINLYSYQEKAVEAALKAKNGVLVMPCGSGKTQCGLEIISRVGGRALWLTHTQELLHQSKDRATCVFDDVGCGTITAGRVDLGLGITFATIQTLAKVDLSEYENYWDVIIVDECQHCAGSPTKVTQFYKVVSKLSARYKIGLTATPKRADGLERSIFALLGSVIHEIKRKEVEATTCKVKVKRIETGYMPDYDCILMGDGTIDYNKLIDHLTHDQDRFEVVMDTLMSLPRSKPVMVLGNRVEYLQNLCREYKKRQIGDAICLSGMKSTKKEKEARKKALNALNDGELDCIFATYQLAKEGLDVPQLRYVVLATPEKDETTVIQSVGRVGRKAEDKDFGYAIDFVDSFALHKKWAGMRLGYYKKIEARVEE